MEFVSRTETTLLGHVREQTIVTDCRRTRAKPASVIQDSLSVAYHSSRKCIKLPRLTAEACGGGFTAVTDGIHVWQ
jgi:hypothetical protein